MFRRWQLYASLPSIMISLYILNLLVPRQTSRTTIPGTYQYFRDANFATSTRLLGAVSHHDARFALMHFPPTDELRHVLRDLLDSYFAFMGTINTVSWISHGTLLGWAWNQDLLPWDTDIDTQLSEDALKLLATTYNMTKFVHNGTNTTRRYLLDVNPHYNITAPLDVANSIDARWIDTTTGKFVDITALRSYEQRNRQKLSCKGGHTYMVRLCRNTLALRSDSNSRKARYIL